MYQARTISAILSRGRTCKRAGPTRTLCRSRRKTILVFQLPFKGNSYKKIDFCKSQVLSFGCVTWPKEEMDAYWCLYHRVLFVRRVQHVPRLGLCERPFQSSCLWEKNSWSMKCVVKSVKVGNGNDIEGNDSCAYKSCSWSSKCSCICSLVKWI